MDTGLTYASEWAALDGPERGAWLRSKGIRVHVAKTESGAVQAAWDALNLAAMERGDGGGNGVSAVITWLGSGIDWTSKPRYALSAMNVARLMLKWHTAWPQSRLYTE